MTRRGQGYLVADLFENRQRLLSAVLSQNKTLVRDILESVFSRTQQFEHCHL